MSPQHRRTALLGHWTSTATQCAPPPLPPLTLKGLASAGGRNLLAQCEALLRQLLRRRREALRLPHSELVHVAAEFNGSTLRAPARCLTAMAFVLTGMYWGGSRHPLSLFATPLHPPTGLVRWLTRYSVQDQVDYGQLLLTRLVQEEQRMFGFALRLTERIDAMTGNRDRGLVMLPELLRIAEA